MLDTRTIRELHSVLASIYRYDFQTQAINVMEKAGIAFENVLQSNIPRVYWYNIVTYAIRVDRLNQLLEVVTAADAPEPRNAVLLRLKLQILDGVPVEPVQGEDVSEANWQPRINYEALTMGQNTLLPILFLETGTKCSKSVARVKIGQKLGSCFLIENNLIVTNNHVIGTIEEAKKANIEFNYEYGLGKEGKSVMKEPITLFLKPDEYFFTSKENDFTLVKIDDRANKDFGFLKLADKEIKAGEYVNIIQHPEGGAKKIALYHNVVTNSDAGNNRVQYLTDTMPGSSGSPVFNSDWEVVVLHNSSGYFDEQTAQKVIAATNTAPKQLRNQGININVIKKELNF